MFSDIPNAIVDRMALLEDLDAADRAAGSPRLQRLRQIPPITGRFLAIMAAGSPAGEMIEIGTSGGYSTLWLSLACAATDRHLTTFEILPEKAALARETFREAGVEHLITAVEADARDHLADLPGVSFCFLDCEKVMYAECYDLVVPNLVSGGWLIADNAINHRETLQPVLDQAHADGRVDAVIVPIGQGELVCRKI